MRTTLLTAITGWALGLLSLWLFQRGFLLSRLSLPHVSQESMPRELLEQRVRFKRAVLVLVDAMRFDFVSPQPELAVHAYHQQQSSSASTPIDDGDDSLLGNYSLPCHHLMPDVERAIADGRQAMLFHFLADPPTTTLQRLQALLTGSLPTFVDASANFASEILREDTWIHQLKRRHLPPARSIFLGDDTWLRVLGEGVFDHAVGMESFEVWDLDGVDRRILSNLWQHFDASASPWNVFIAHFLGVDHAGHRYGPEHREMTRKLGEMNQVLGRLMREIDDETILLVFGDHGMDRHGDHGGDSFMEVDAGLVVYSKLSLLGDKGSAKRLLLERIHARLRAASFNETLDDGYRAVQQIDLLPSLSFLFGQAIPFGNLGSLIPEVALASLADASEERELAEPLLSMLRYNSHQIARYLSEYGQKTGIRWQLLDRHMEKFGEAEGMWRAVNDRRHANATLFSPYIFETPIKFNTTHSHTTSHYLDSIVDAIAKYHTFNRLTLESCRELWARFDVPSMTGGSLIFFAVAIFKLIRVAQGNPAIAAIIILHASIFASNSYVVHEDTVVSFVLHLTILLVWCFNKQASSIAAPASLMLLSRLLSTSTICREEQLPHCVPTFAGLPPVDLLIFEFFGTPQDPQYAVFPPTIIALFITAGLLPWLFSQYYRQQPALLRINFHIIMLCHSTYWALHGVDERLAAAEYPWLAMWVARVGFLTAVLSIVGITVRVQPLATRLTDALPFIFGFILMTMLPTGGWMLSLGFACILTILWWLERMDVDTLRRSHRLVALALSLLGQQLFFATGHQATFSSIQFQTGFIGLPLFDFYLSGGLVVVNSVGAWLLCMYAAVLISFAVIRPRLNSVDEAQRHLTVAIAHCLATTFSSMVFTQHFRRHLMVWKVFAPRFMLTGIETVIKSSALTVVVFIHEITTELAVTKSKKYRR